MKENMSKKDKVKFYSEGFRQDIEGVRTNYESYKKKGEPSSSSQQKALDRGSNKAYETVSQANREADYESKRERNRAEAAASGKGRPDYSKKWVE